MRRERDSTSEEAINIFPHAKVKQEKKKVFTLRSGSVQERNYGSRRAALGKRLSSVSRALGPLFPPPLPLVCTNLGGVMEGWCSLRRTSLVPSGQGEEKDGGGGRR